MMLTDGLGYFRRLVPATNQLGPYSRMAAFDLPVDGFANIMQ